ncbi:flagellar assembly protein FliH [Marinobacter sp. VGCF2001]|uniref:flagellar assembly protein FliH n=1 Tax=Marinobacter sp. VGCF2001 TaxID=3417189 RepID=UPI003CE6D5DB
MKDSDHGAKDRPKEQMTAWERWELPLLDERGNQVAQEEEVRPLTASDLEEIRTAAREDGFQEGRAAGHSEGFEQGRSEGHQAGYAAGEAEGRAYGEQQAQEQTRQEVASRMERLEHLMGELLLPIQRHEEELESVLVNLSTVLARAVVFRELSMDSSHIRQVVRRALSELPSTADSLRIHIHPDDIEPVREVAERLETAAVIVEDESVMAGGCKVESRHSLVDFTVEKRFQRVVQGMLEEQLVEPAGKDQEDVVPNMGALTDFHRDVLSDSGMAAPSTVESEPPRQERNDDNAPG